MGYVISMTFSYKFSLLSQKTIGILIKVLYFYIKILKIIQEIMNVLIKYETIS